MNIPSVDPTPGLGFAATFLAIGWITLGLRIYTRRWLMGHWYHEDTAMGVCLPFFTVFGIATIQTSRLTELGSHKFIPLKDITAATTWFLLTTWFYLLTTLFLKISIALFFIRVAVLRWQRMLIGGLTVLVTLATGWAFFLILFHCGPFSSIQELILKRLAWQCVPSRILIACGYFHASVVAVVDWAFVLLPFAILQNTSLTRKEKWTIGPLMALASIGGLASLVRFKYCRALGIKGIEVLTGSAGLNVWSTIEAGISVSAVNITCLPPLLRKYAQSMKRASLPISSYLNQSLHYARTMISEKSIFARSFRDDKSKSEDTRHDSGAAERPLCGSQTPNDGAGNGNSWQLPNIARLSVLKLPDVDTPRDEEALFYHTEKFDVPIVLDFSLAYPEASKSNS